MKKIIVFFTAFFLLLRPGFSQRSDKQVVDSLLSLLSKAKEDTVKLNLYAELMLAHVYYKPQEGTALGKTALELAQKLNWKTGIAKIKHRVGRLYWRLGNFEEAFKNHTEALELFRQTGDKKAEGIVLIEIGQDYLDNGKIAEAKTALQKALQFNRATGNEANIARLYDILCYLYESQGDFAEAQKIACDYLKLSEKLGNKSEIAHSAHMLGCNYQVLGNNTEALKYFFKGLLVAEDKIDKMQMNVSIGEVYLAQKKFPEALKHYSTAKTMAAELNDMQILGWTNFSIGKFYQAQGDYNNALENYLSAEACYKSISNKQDLAALYTNLGSIYTNLKKFGEANKYFNKALALYEQLNTRQSMGEYHSAKEKLDSATGNWQSAYRHYKQFITIRDSAYNKENLQKLIGSQLQYENEKKEAIVKAEQEKKDLLVKEEIKRQLNIRNASFAVLAVAMVFSLIALRQRNKLAKEKKRSDQLLQDKELLLREIHHRVKNNLEVVSSLLALQGAQINDPNTKEAMLEGQNRVQSIGIVHQKLYQGENLGAIEMQDYFINLSESILDSFGAEKRVQIECVMDKLNIDIDTAVPLGLIVNELLTNTLKYAFPDGRDGKVQIKLEKRTDGVLQLQVSDNGIGKSGITKGTGFGSQLVSLLTQQLSGTMKEEINNGTRTIFEFKTGNAA